MKFNSDYILATIITCMFLILLTITIISEQFDTNGQIQSRYRDCIKQSTAIECNREFKLK